MPSIGSILPILRKSGSSDISSPPAGWIGSKAGQKGDLVTIDSSGRVDQVVAVSTAITSSSPRIAALGQNLKDTVPATTIVIVEKLDDDTLIALQASNASDAAVVTAKTMVGQQYPLRRTAGGTYVVNTATNTAPVVEMVGLDPRYNEGEAGGTLLCRVLPSMRLA